MGSFRLPATIGEYDFLLELQGFNRSTLDTIRQQADESERTGEQTLSPDDLWRRSQFDFRGGEGQTDGDAPESNPTRFAESEGVDPWTRGRLSRLPGVSSVDASGTKALPVGGRIFQINGSTLAYTDNYNWTSQANSGSFGATVVDLTSDGSNVYVTNGATVMLIEADDPASVVTLNNLDCDRLWYVKGRLMAAAAADIYNITDITTTDPPSPLTPSTINDNWTWSDMSGGGSSIYACGYSGGVGLVYRITVRQDGTELDAPVVAAELPYGEIPYALFSYGNLIFVGTNLGLRVSLLGSGFLELGPLIEVGPVRHFAAYKSDLYFSYERAYGSGVGRVSLDAPLVDVLQPAYAKDIVAAGVMGEVTSLFFWQEGLHFTVSGQGTYQINPAANAAVSTLTTSTFDFAVPDPKTFELFTLRTDPLPSGASVAVEFFVDGVKVGSTQTHSTVGSSSSTSEIAATGEEIYAKLTLTGSPVVRRVAFRAWPLPRKGEVMVLPLILRSEVEDRGGRTVRLDVKEAFNFLMGLKESATQTTLTLFGDDFRVVVDKVQMSDDLDYLPNMDFVEGVCYVQVRSWQ